MSNVTLETYSLVPFRCYINSCASVRFSFLSRTSLSITLKGFPLLFQFFMYAFSIIFLHLCILTNVSEMGSYLLKRLGNFISMIARDIIVLWEFYFSYNSLEIFLRFYSWFTLHLPLPQTCINFTHNDIFFRL